MRFLFTCGGTAGHINPAVGIAGRIRELMPASEILFVGAAGNMETELVPLEGFKISTITVSNLQRSIKPDKILHNINTFKNIITAYGESKKIIREFSPDVAIGTGGYVCYPVLRAAAALKVPAVIHESNAVPGLTTRMLENVVDKIFAGFDAGLSNYKDIAKVIVTGTPVRIEFTCADREKAKSELGLPADKPLVVSVWGSLGSDFMNGIMSDFIKRLCRKPSFSLIHAAGSRGYADMTEKLKIEGADFLKACDIDVREYIFDMPRVMAAADLVLCRSGASTLSELCALGKPSILIPSPNVTGNHQEKNARVMESANAAVVMPEGSFSADSLLGEVSSLLAGTDLLELMSGSAKKVGGENATEKITEILLEMAKKPA
ncbi:MAG: UDP-N-acetylglucosamine--N-acetylmuramyl-(pentapeptide) pyrophosphoryl-undecaprenol N-acetylglucosamine transferase [Oscillospiraceae bacterium]|nr:UDP-N-acetylglucosamine--N-acetylmuramyl-(pentapeptide) pyrophosphoryl-undecaprenol N-acetylglucosamine transferase [Oscillospiraceae bacterium]